MKRFFTLVLHIMLLALFSVHAQTLTLDVKNKPMREVLPA